METSVFVSQFAPGSPKNWWFIIIFPIYKWQFWSFLCLKLGNGPPNKWNGHLVYTIFTHIVEFLNGPAICRKDQIHPRLFHHALLCRPGNADSRAILQTHSDRPARVLDRPARVLHSAALSLAGHFLAGLHVPRLKWQWSKHVGTASAGCCRAFRQTCRTSVFIKQVISSFQELRRPFAQAGPGWVARPGWASWPRWTSPRSRNLPWWFVPWGWAMATSILGAWWSWPSKGPEGDQLTLLELGVDLSQLFNTQKMRTECNGEPECKRV